MASERIPRHCVIDGFLPADVLADLLSYTLAQQSATEPTVVQEREGGKLDTGVRRSERLAEPVGPHWKGFRQALDRRLDDLFAALGIAPFPVVLYEREIVAHLDGGFYRRHIDTFTADIRDTSDRVISAVFYFHAEPKAFTGGELALYPFGNSPEPARLIEPVNNRLVAFPSFALHEVRPVHCPGDDFANARFAINCWLHRAR